MIFRHASSAPKVFRGGRRFGLTDGLRAPIHVCGVCSWVGAALSSRAEPDVQGRIAPHPSRARCRARILHASYRALISDDGRSSHSERPPRM